VVYDTDHFADTFFILDAAWRHHEGYEPTLDFGHFYGGIVEKFISLAMTLFGLHAKAIDWGLVLLFLALCPVLALVCWRRVSRIGTALAALVLATLLFTRFPLENAESITRLASTHSFTYNRLGLGLFLIVGLMVALPAGSRRWEIAGGLVAGVLLVVLSLTKPTFIVLPPFALLALVPQRRGAALLACLAGIVVGVLLLDPLGARWSASFAYAQASHSEDANVSVLSLIRKSVQAPLAQPSALALVLISAGLLLWQAGRETWSRILAVILMVGGGLGMTATMGGVGSLGQIALPLLCFAMIVAHELALRQDWTAAAAIPVMTLGVVGAFVLPHVGNLLGVTSEAILRRDRVLVHEGPLAGYLSLPETPSEGPDQYQMLADGLSFLRRIDDVSDLTVVADGGISFEFALPARPALDFPLWPRPASPEFAPGNDFLADVDIVMLVRASHPDPEAIQPGLRSALGDEFSLCGRTRYWEVYVRPEAVRQPCGEGGVRPDRNGGAEARAEDATPPTPPGGDPGTELP
jgi:hypothetical protein